MSLKHFHIFFIFACILCLLGFGGYCLYDYSSSGDNSLLTCGIGFVVVGTLLIAYLVRFLHKSKREGIS
jgi:hypothetical protein